MEEKALFLMGTHGSILFPPVDLLNKPESAVRTHIHNLFKNENNGPYEYIDIPYLLEYPAHFFCEILLKNQGAQFF